jgi:hypothetical protein
MIKVDGREFWTMFDSGARNTYVLPSVAKLLMTAKVSPPFRSLIGGGVKESDTDAILQAQVQGRRISTHAWVVDYLGKDDGGKPIEILFGALAMQQWGIRPIPDREELDMTHYPDVFEEF